MSDVLSEHEKRGQLALTALRRAVAKAYASGEAFIPDAELQRKIDEASRALYEGKAQKS